jgi:hypothetical protein
MRPIKCLLLLAAVLSFAAMNAAYDLQPGDDERCRLWDGTDEEFCFACCKLLTKPTFQTMYTMSDSAWDEGLCICSLMDEPFTPPGSPEIREFDRLVSGEVEKERRRRRRRVIPGVRITKID